MPPRHVVETYIKATPERIWAALTEPRYTEQYMFACRVNSGWEPGDTYQYEQPGSHAAFDGQLVEVDPPRRLVMTFHVPWDDVAAAEAPSRLTWEITPMGDVCRVTLIHGDLGLSPRTWELTTGWPVVIAGLKTVLETGRALGVVERDGDAERGVAAGEPIDVSWHRALAAEANNGVYDLLDAREATPAARSADADDRLVHRAHAAAYHWGIAGGIEQRAMAEYLCSRVYAYVGRSEPAVHHALRCGALTDEAGLGGWQLAYAHEAMARALACAGRRDEARAELAAALALPIDDDADAAILHGDLAAGPWYGLEVPTPAAT
jgi:uncharacterized protein YndB with AHSA1/START domain